ncbi:TROVE domain-containing protein [Candidatus Woesebacteria bacterium RBG_13_36_22]|uniref:TROVE domain-containing protein n=1 Tax=Candidatus Woesebacteria bacterium RBG_13_36_22 TaxID=1802478 RepID=A0A1F7X321_9BACT|nr:MAG: TROVE domain-containing protein [Candidatus Woesebacteria bacterium RBG_13_36_22]
MAKLNIKPNPIFTHEGAKACHINPELQLKRSVMSCLLFEKEFYEDGESIADRIKNLIPQVAPEKVYQIALEARNQMKLRHMPLFIVREMARLEGYKKYVSDALFQVIQRADELSEFLAIYWKEGKKPLSAQVKKGLARAFVKFNAYQLAKYNRDGQVKLKDVLFLCHAKPETTEQAETWKKLVDGSLESPDTWEVALSSGGDKKEHWERLLKENKLGGLALLRNLRNFSESKVSESLIFNALEQMKTEKILPFRFISAAKYAPQWENKIEPIMLKCLEGKEKLKGKTALLIDGSGSMFGTPISAKSEIDRFEAATALAILIKEICEDPVIVVFSNNTYLVPSRRGFALRDAIYKSAEKSGTNTQNGINSCAQLGYDRLIILTDEQSHQSIHNPLKGTKGYVINVASAKNGIGYGNWIHIDGWSESVIDYISEYEK